MGWLGSFFSTLGQGMGQMGQGIGKMFAGGGGGAAAGGSSLGALSNQAIASQAAQSAAGSMAGRAMAPMMANQAAQTAAGGAMQSATAPSSSQFWSDWKSVMMEPENVKSLGNMLGNVRVQKVENQIGPMRFQSIPIEGPSNQGFSSLSELAASYGR